MDISKNVFLPKPNVDSIIVEFKMKEQQLEVQDKNHFFKLVRDSFTQKRKTLRNNLKAYDVEILSEVLATYNLDLSVRAENLTLEQFVEMSNRLTASQK